MNTERTLPPTSLGIVVCVTAVLLTLLLGTVGVGTPAWVGVASGVGLSVSLWLVRWERWRSVGLVFSSLFAVPVAAGLAGALVGTIAALAAGIVPIESIAAARIDIIDIGTRTVIVLGCVAAAVGATAAPFDVIDTETMATYTNLILRIQLLPVAIGSALFARGTLALLQSRGVVGNALSSLTAVFLTPDPSRTHLAVVCLMIAVGAPTVARAIDSLPLVELFPEHSEPIDAASTRLVQTGWLGVFLVFPAGVIEFGLGQRWLASLVPPLVYDSLVAVTATPLLRQLIWWLFLWSIVTIGVARLLRRTAQGSPDDVGVTTGPYIASAAVSGVALAASDLVVSVLLDAIPAPVGESVTTTVEPFITQFGTGSITLVLVSVVLGISGVVVGALWFALRVRYVPERTAGVTLAASGLFLASGAALTLDVSPLFGVGGLVGAIVVWDAGAFGTTLRTEMGSGTDTRRTELVHTGGTLSVGVVGTLLTLGLAGTARGAVSVDSGTALAALVFCLVAVVALIIALR